MNSNFAFTAFGLKSVSFDIKLWIIKRQPFSYTAKDFLRLYHAPFTSFNLVAFLKKIVFYKAYFSRSEL